MEYTRLGRTGLNVSRICLGTMNFGPETTEDDAHAIMDHAVASGINFFDTANVYGRKMGPPLGLPNPGITESIIGRWLAKSEQNRERIVLATKVYAPMTEGPNGRKLSAYHLVRACEASLKRLQTDRIDLYQMHHIDRDTPWEEIYQAMELLVSQGKVLYVGSSNFAGWHIAKACEVAKSRHFLGLVSEQSLYNLHARTVELEVIPACKDYGLGLIPWSPLSGGLLGGVLAKEAKGRRSSDRIKQMIDANRKSLEAWEGYCAERGESPADVALAWLLKNPVVTAPIVGPRTKEQLDENMGALAVKLDDAAMKKLDAIWPGPGGQAPEAYAW